MTATPPACNSQNTSPCPELEPKGSSDSLSPPGSKSRHWSRLLPLPRWTRLGATSLHPGALGRALLGGGHGAVLGNLLLGAAPPREPVVVPELAEALGHALRRQPRLGVVVPALDERLTDHLDALQGAQTQRPWGGSHQQRLAPRAASAPSEFWGPFHVCSGGSLWDLMLLSWGRCFLFGVFFFRKPYYNIFSALVGTVISGHVVWYNKNTDASD